MKKIVIIDNYDSFTYNLVHYTQEITEKVTVYRNDDFEIEELAYFDKIIISPGPGIPDEAGLIKEVIQKYASSKSILGICLGHQAIAEVFGGEIINLNKVYHGVSSTIKVILDDEKLFKNLPNEFNAGRYHSWIVKKETLPNELLITSVDENQEIMSLKHKIHDVRGVQFHPESILTPYGKILLKNWIES